MACAAVATVDPTCISFEGVVAPAAAGGEERMPAPPPTPSVVVFVGVGVLGTPNIEEVCAVIKLVE